MSGLEQLQPLRCDVLRQGPPSLKAQHAVSSPSMRHPRTLSQFQIPSRPYTEVCCRLRSPGPWHPARQPSQAMTSRGLGRTQPPGVPNASSICWLVYSVHGKRLLALLARCSLSAARPLHGFCLGEGSQGHVGTASKTRNCEVGSLPLASLAVLQSYTVDSYQRRTYPPVPTGMLAPGRQRRGPPRSRECHAACICRQKPVAQYLKLVNTSVHGSRRQEDWHTPLVGGRSTPAPAHHGALHIEVDVAAKTRPLKVLSRASGYLVVTCASALSHLMGCVGMYPSQAGFSRRLEKAEAVHPCQVCHALGPQQCGL